MIGDRIRQARLASGMTLDDLAEKLGHDVTKQALSKYERGASQPPASRLNDLSRALGVRVSFLLSDPTAEVRWRGFRKHASLPKSEMARLSATAEKRLEDELRLRELFQLGTTHDVPIDSGAADFEGAEEAAEQLRERWHLSDAPINGLIETVEAHGAVVVAWEDDDRFDGISGETDAGTPVIVVNLKRSSDRIRFDVAHELGHLVVRAGSDEPQNELLAHRFAAAFLVPRASAVRELGKRRRSLSIQELGLLKQRWGLSMQGWVHRAFDLGVIDSATNRALNIEFRVRRWKVTEPVDYEGLEAPALLRRLLWRAIAERAITHQEAIAVIPELDAEPEARLTAEQPTFRELARMNRSQRLAALEKLDAPLVDPDQIEDWKYVDAADVVEAS